MEQLQLLFSFTKICIRCGIEKDQSAFNKNQPHKNKDGIRQPCKECRKAERALPEEKEKSRVRHKNYRIANKEIIAKKDSARYKANKPKYQAYLKQYYESNKDHLKTKARNYVRCNSEANKIKCSMWYHENKDRAKKNFSLTYLKNKERYFEYSRNRRAMKLNAEGTHTTDDIDNLYREQKGVCSSCSSILKTSGKEKYHIDHIIPLSKGGSNWPENLQLLCPKCNLSKRNKTPEEWESYKKTIRFSLLHRTSGETHHKDSARPSPVDECESFSQV